ncbi:MAG TPA: hypothetical protein VFJ57_10595 [Solirubrobacterales bacterium]|nr:hypothetical protein [Solirubrobacterales bacterium]
MISACVRCAFVASILALTGCGANELVTLEEGEIRTALIGTEDLPPGAEVTEDSPEPCGPIPILEDAAEAAMTKTYGFGETRVKAAIGFYDTEREASKAFEELSSDGRRECIGDSIGRYSNSRNVVDEPLESLGVADTESLTRYLVNDPGSEAEQAVDTATLRFGLCVETIIQFQEDGSAEAARELFETAAQPAIETCQ